jgi:hypothetical protein
MLTQCVRGTAARQCLRSTAVRGVATEARLEELGYELPTVNAAKVINNCKTIRPDWIHVQQGNYKLCNQFGNLVFTAGHLPQPAKGDLMVGKASITGPHRSTFAANIRHRLELKSLWRKGTKLQKSHA